MAAKKLSETMTRRLCEVVKAGSLELAFKHKGGWVSGELSATDSALLTRGLIKIVNLKNDPIVAGGMKPRYARPTDAGREMVKGLVAKPVPEAKFDPAVDMPAAPAMKTLDEMSIEEYRRSTAEARGDVYVSEWAATDGDDT